MKKMRKVGVVASALATTAVCASMIVGSTFALFTDEKQVDITVTSGNVEVESKVENAKITHAASITKEGEEYVVSYENATVDEFEVDGNELSLTNIIPGDVIEFDISLENVGSVAVNYQYSLTATEGLKLLTALEVQIAEGTATVANDDAVYAGTKVKSYTSAWGELAITDSETASKTATYHVTLTLPAKAGNDYQNITSKLEVGTYAVQYNAYVDKTAEAVVETIPEGVVVYDVKSAADFEKALTKDNVYVAVNNDLTIDGELAFENKYSHIDLLGNTITGKPNAVNLIDETMAAWTATNGANVTISNGTLDFKPGLYNTYKNNYYDDVITSKIYTDIRPMLEVEAASSLILDGVTLNVEGVGVYAHDSATKVEIKNSAINASGYAFGTSADNSSYWNVNVVLENSKFISERSAGIYMNIPGTMTVKNCLATGATQGLYVRAGNVEVLNSTFKLDKTSVYDDNNYDWYNIKKSEENNKYYVEKGNNVATETVWGSGNSGARAAVVIGMKGRSEAYPSAQVKLTDCKVSTVSNFLMYYWANSNDTTIECKDLIVLEGSKAGAETVVGQDTGINELVVTK